MFLFFLERETEDKQRKKERKDMHTEKGLEGLGLQRESEMDRDTAG